MQDAGDDQRRVVVRAVATVAVGFLAMATLAAITLPWRGLADAGSHLDYVVHVHRGELLPPYGDGFEPFDRPGAPPAVAEADGDAEGADRQYASAHPPGYYAALAVIAGDDLADGHWERAVIKIRAVNVLLGLGGLVALAAFGWVVGGRWRARLAIALPAVGTANLVYLRYSGEVYNDMAVTACALGALALAAAVLVRGPSVTRLLGLAVLCAAGMGAKATFVVTLGVVALAVAAGTVAHGPPGRRTALRAVAASAAVVVVAIASFAWFYERNRRLSGSWYRSTPKVPVGDRPRRSLGDVLTDPDLYRMPFDRLAGQGGAFATGALRWASRAITVPAFALSGVVAARRAETRGRWAPSRWSRRSTVLAGLLVLHLLGHVALQISHAVGYGGLNWRYFLPATTTLAFGLAVGVAGAGRASAVLLPGLVGSLWTAAAVSMATYGRTEDQFGSLGVVGSLRDGAAANDLPSALPVLLLVTAALSLVALAAQVWRRPDLFDPDTGPTPTDEPAAIGAP